MPYTRAGEFQWEYPATVVTVYDGATFLVDADLGCHVHLRLGVICQGIGVEPITTAEGMLARKTAQRLLHDARLTIKVLSLDSIHGRPMAVAEVLYAPTHEPRSDQGSFLTAMLASGYARRL